MPYTFLMLLPTKWLIGSLDCWHPDVSLCQRVPLCNPSRRHVSTTTYERTPPLMRKPIQGWRVELQLWFLKNQLWKALVFQTAVIIAMMSISCKIISKQFASQVKLNKPVVNAWLNTVAGQELRTAGSGSEPSTYMCENKQGGGKGNKKRMDFCWNCIYISKKSCAGSNYWIVGLHLNILISPNNGLLEEHKCTEFLVHNLRELTCFIKETCNYSTLSVMRSTLLVLGGLQCQRDS